MLSEEQRDNLLRAILIINCVRIDLMPDKGDRDNADEQDLGEIESDLADFIKDNSED